MPPQSADEETTLDNLQIRINNKCDSLLFIFVIFVYGTYLTLFFVDFFYSFFISSWICFVMSFSNLLDFSLFWKSLFSLRWNNKRNLLRRHHCLFPNQHNTIVVDFSFTKRERNQKKTKQKNWRTKISKLKKCRIKHQFNVFELR